MRLDDILVFKPSVISGCTAIDGASITFTHNKTRNQSTHAHYSSAIFVFILPRGRPTILCVSKWPSHLVPRVLRLFAPLTKKPEDSGCEHSVCVTRHKDLWVKLLMYLISSVTRMHLVRETRTKIRDQNTASFSEKHFGRERFGEFSRSHSGLRCLLFALKTISISLSRRFGDDRRCNFSSFLLLRRFLCTVWRWVYMYIWQDFRITPHINYAYIHCSKKKNSSISSVWWTLLPGRGKQTKSKVRNLASSLITMTYNNYYIILFSSTSLYYFTNCACLQCLCANKTSIRQGKKKNRPKEPDSYSTMVISPKLRPQNCLFIEVSAVYRFCYKPNLTV